jgi:hypothetical protein
MNETKIAALREEIDATHFANVLYWREGRQHSPEAVAEYERRQRRLREIKAAQLALACEGDNCA